MTEAKIPEVFKRDEDIAVISKLITDPHSSNKQTIDKDNFIKLSKYTYDAIKSNETIISMFPDMELAIEIIISSVLSPNSMVDENLLYSITNLPLPIEVTNIVVPYIKEYMNEQYQIEDKLDTILEESYYTKGAYIQAVIPEASLDEIINRHIYKELTPTIENLGLDRPTGILDVTDVTVQIGNNHYVNDLVTFTDNREVLCFNDISKKIINGTALTKYTGLESKNLELDSIFKQYLETNEVTDVIEVKNSEQTIRESIGVPLVIKIPTEAVIPVHVVGDPTQHIGYFVLLNDYGVPITYADEWRASDEEKRLSMLTNGTVGKSKNNVSTLVKTVPMLSDLEQLYGNIINRQIKEVLNNSKYGGISEVTEVNTIYNIMLNRALRNQHTRVLFLDASTISYVAFEYRDNGTGKSQLEKLKTLSSMRAIATMTRIMANVKNSIVNTEIDVKLDEDDPDPEKTVEMVIEEVTKSRELLTPFHLETMDDLVRWSRRVGYTFNFKHDTRLPDMEITHRDVAGERAEPDRELDDKYKKDMISALGLTPEKIDTAFSGKFATTEILNDTLMVKRVIKIQKQYEIQLTNMIRTILRNDYKFRAKLVELYTNNIRKIRTTAKRKKEVEEKVLKHEKMFIDYLVRTTINNVTVKLPRPDTTENENLNEHFKNYKDAVEEYVGILFSSDALPPELIGELGDDLEPFQTAIINTLLRKWGIENNYLTEVLEIINDGKNVGLSILDDYADYSEMVVNIMLKFLKKNERRKKKHEKVYDKLTDMGDDELGDLDDLNNEEDLDKGEKPSDSNDAPPSTELPKEE